MHPVLIDLGPFSLHSYGLAMAVAFALGIWIASRRAEARGFGSKFALDISILILIFSLLGARFTYVVTHLEEFKDYPLDTISPIQHTGKIGIEGLVLLGGVAAAFLTVYIYARRKGHKFLAVTDLLIPSLALGIAIGRIGCFFNGCCFGLPTSLPWGVHFPHNSLAGYVFPDQCVHPTQMYEVFYALLIFTGLMIYDRPPKPMGRVTGIFLTAYGIARFLNEGLRWYEHEMVIMQTVGFRMTFSQIISLLMILSGVALILASAVRKSPSNAEQQP
ncbi:MAG: prolipoprotein diacylglyceryl transferase [Calditrichota bacterium]